MTENSRQCASLVRILIGNLQKLPVKRLELSCCKKRQKKSQPRNWFGELGTSEGAEWYQIDHK